VPQSEPQPTAAQPPPSEPNPLDSEPWDAQPGAPAAKKLAEAAKDPRMRAKCFSMNGSPIYLNEGWPPSNPACGGQNIPDEMYMR
jgi:hypothetical protein